MSSSQPTGCNCADPYILTMEEWKKLHKDYKGIENGQRYALRLCHVHGTVSKLVVIRTNEKRKDEKR